MFYRGVPAVFLNAYIFEYLVQIACKLHSKPNVPRYWAYFSLALAPILSHPFYVAAINVMYAPYFSEPLLRSTMRNTLTSLVYLYTQHGIIKGLYRGFLISTFHTMLLNSALLSKIWHSHGNQSM